MSAMHERTIKGEQEFKESFGYKNKKNSLDNISSKSNNELQERKKNMMSKSEQIFEGTIVAAGWDSLDHMNQSSLYTQDDEDILLDHLKGIRKFKPYLNQKVRVWGNVVKTNKEGRRISVKKIKRLANGFTQKSRKVIDDYNDFVPRSSF